MYAHALREMPDYKFGEFAQNLQVPNRFLANSRQIPVFRESKSNDYIPRTFRADSLRIPQRFCIPRNLRFIDM